MTGEELRKFLTSSGYILKDIAEKLNLTPQALDSRLRSKKVSIETLNQIALALNKDITFFETEKQEFPNDFQSLIETVRLQAQIIKNKDEQIDRLINLLENQLNKGNE